MLKYSDQPQTPITVIKKYSHQKRLSLKLHRVLLECKNLQKLCDRVGPPSKAKSRDARLKLQRVHCAWRALRASNWRARCFCEFVQRVIIDSDNEQVTVNIETNYCFVVTLFGADEAERPSLAQWKCFRGAWSAERGCAVCARYVSKRNRIM